MFVWFYFDVGWNSFWCLQLNCTARATIVWKFDSYATMIKVRRLNAGFVRPNFEWLDYRRARHCRAVRPILLIPSSFLDGIWYSWWNFGISVGAWWFRWSTLLLNWILWWLEDYVSLRDAAVLLRDIEVLEFDLWILFMKFWFVQFKLVFPIYIDWLIWSWIFLFDNPKTSGKRHEIP